MYHSPDFIWQLGVMIRKENWKGFTLERAKGRPGKEGRIEARKKGERVRVKTLFSGS